VRNRLLADHERWPLMGDKRMSTVVARPVSCPRRRPDWHKYLGRLRAAGALILLVAFVLAGGHRTLEERDEDD
jgi:hypothetical protein